MELRVQLSGSLLDAVAVILLLSTMSLFFPSTPPKSGLSCYPRSNVLRDDEPRLPWGDDQCHVETGAQAVGIP